jgi:putative DNA primase/helicase
MSVADMFDEGDSPPNAQRPAPKSEAGAGNELVDSTSSVSNVADLDERRVARTKSGTPSGTDKMVADDVIAEICDYYLNEIDPAITGERAPAPSEIKQTILDRTNLRLAIINGDFKGTDRTPRLKLLVPSQLARILIRLHHVVMINAQGLGASRSYDLLAIYRETGSQVGTYATDELDIKAIIHRYNQELNSAGCNEVLSYLREMAPQVGRTVKAELTPFANGIWNYRTRELMDFDPSLVFTSKMVTPMDVDAESPVYYRAHDTQGVQFDRDIEADEVATYQANGWNVTRWDVVEWISSLSDDPDMVALLWQIIGASLRPYVRWNKTAWFYSERGNNGKGTLAELMRLVIGQGACAVLPLANFGKDFMLEPLTHASAIIVDENDVGIYLDKVSNLKAIVTNDVISINRKGQVPINYRFWGFMVQCLNELPQIRDRTESFYRRQLFVPFEKHFEGGGFRYIKEDYLQRPEVHQYVVNHVMTVVDEYWKLSEPAATQKLLDHYKEANDPVREYWNEVRSEFKWTGLPNGFVFQVYLGWYPKTNPSGKPLGRNKFLEQLRSIIAADPEWAEAGEELFESKGRMDISPEPLILKYNLEDWMERGYAGADLQRRCSPTLKDRYRGFKRISGTPARPVSKANFYKDED